MARTALRARVGPSETLTRTAAYRPKPTFGAWAVYARIGRRDQIGQARNIVRLAVKQQTSIRRDLAALQFRLQAAVEFDPKLGLSGLIRRLSRVWSAAVIVLYCFL